MPTQDMRACVQLAIELPWTFENMLRIAQAYLDEPSIGDATPELVQSFIITIPSDDEAEQLNQAIERMRREHFAKLGKPVPVYTGPSLR